MEPETHVIADVVRKHFTPGVIEVSGQDGQARAQVLAVPDGVNGINIVSVKSFVDEYRQHPERRKGTSKLLTLQSFIDHTNRFRNDDSAVFADSHRENPSMLVVFDYHERVNVDGERNRDALPQFGGHRATYHFPVSDEWKIWNQFNEQKLTQTEFAEFLEDRINDVEVPPNLTGEPESDDDPTRKLRLLLSSLGGSLAGPARLMELSRGLKVTAEERVHQAVNLSNGETQLQYTHEHLDEQGQPLKVPNLFLINIPVFQFGDVFRVPVRLRYRSRGGSITWSYSLYNKDRVFDTAFKEAVAQVSQETTLPVFIGYPEK